MEAGGEGDAGAKQGVNAGQVIHRYGLQFAAQAPDIALEYYMLASQALGNDRLTKARLVRELLTESNAFGYLLGSGAGPGGAPSSSCYVVLQQESENVRSPYPTTWTLLE